MRSRSSGAPFGARARRHGDADTPRNEPQNERGAVTIFAIVALVFAAALMLGIARLGHAVNDKARAESAADASALAAAGVLARGGSAVDASNAAAETAASNDAHFNQCECSGARPIVTVRVGDATARAGAEVRFECFADPDSC
jgi:secretion/DNA translocation related TadE-like protein